MWLRVLALVSRVKREWKDATDHSGLQLSSPLADRRTRLPAAAFATARLFAYASGTRISENGKLEFSLSLSISSSSLRTMAAISARPPARAITSFIQSSRKRCTQISHQATVIKSCYSLIWQDFAQEKRRWSERWSSLGKSSSLNNVALRNRRMQSRCCGGKRGFIHVRFLTSGGLLRNINCDD